MRSYKATSCAAILCVSTLFWAYAPSHAATDSKSFSLAFAAMQPWWLAWPFIALGIILFASAAVAAFRLRLLRSRKRTHQLENLLSARTIELAIANADLERLSVTDPLTGLKNRRFLEFSISEDLARVRRAYQCSGGESDASAAGSPDIGFLVIDIDHFKQVNDRFGHAAGDSILRQIASVFSSVLRESDSILRWGGEEFLIIARSPRGNDSATLAERLRKRIETTGFFVNNEQRTFKLTCSIGFASWPFFRCAPDAVGWQDVLGLADRCLYLAKNGGRNAWFGVSSRSDYAGIADCGILSDFSEAEAKGIIRIQSSASREPEALVPCASHHAPHQERNTIR